MEKLAANAPIHTDRPGHIVNIATNAFTQVRDLVNERDLGGQKGVRRIFG